MYFKYDTEWYNSLKKPNFQPQSWVFTPVWSVLYVLMFISFALILLSPLRWMSAVAYILFVAQFTMNLSWTPTFFIYHDLKKSFFICFLLTVLVFLMMIVFFHISKLAGIITIPYFLWMVYATVLNFEIWELNSD